MTDTILWKYTNEEYNEMYDEKIIELVRLGDKNALDYLINKYTDVVNIKVSKYFIVGAEKEDIVQEGLIGLYKAIKSFDLKKDNSFRTFANLCIERQLITAIKTSNRQKHIPLNSYLSLNMSAYEDEETDTILDVLDFNKVEDPLETITKKEYYLSIENAINKSLSEFEKKVLNGFSIGKSYIQIANELNAPVKSVDNAIQRIRKKASKNLNINLIDL